MCSIERTQRMRSLQLISPAHARPTQAPHLQRAWGAQVMAEHLRQAPDLLPTLLTTLFEIVLFEDCSNQWSLSRPMLSLILVNEQARTPNPNPNPC